MPAGHEDIGLPQDDEAFMRYRERRIQELCGKVEEVVSEKELIEKTKSLRMIVHFYKPEFKRCKTMDKGLEEVKDCFPGIRFYRVNAEICPVVARKLEIRVLPFLGFFKDGYFVDQVVGFEKLGGDSVEPEVLKKRILDSNIFKPISSI
ncbi:similarity to the THIOREDOXIN family [Encephalitozoon cuniculi GB-M1]|uniref:Similarity to the THIOREDOXIN family n=2 Tax=Encephalitozoon cuniculi TaxID=6035 RepID=Q8SWM0_ENCCU|nr:thioredoxin [Encephalitozoon cuniculi GB-M1]AGE96106.1 thioredoxin family [Encephalitozoon cuniculi]KMV66725.1 thioredoxin [Encephalitozoon cuniculi EcunIII-L]UYI28441.1 thioredoxin [Encephalitozoon cuniculi]CAD24942.1 similarity to the THIOREDOXIN family [Encephalitozoon cuniculi GB-M1]